ncbi:type III-B CRISPR module RAMP protein Cmr4 [Candidatus Oscillochloris fontis]|uniref:type III-B CRISPR module RAMP protein Cmr4 n=1 Tax=Candidatus Oscillochloris fontis TaxID=2496868 RepID=UPI00101D8F3E|nr:type III-B CRISPR module RAMP protein Cmr4 [Candidatus Oscillochloris fontis]
MTTTTRLLFIHALSPLHAGTGQGSGVIDLPIAREKATGLPYLPGSSIKGTLRDSAGLSPEETAAIFGPDTTNAAEFAGSVQFADARLLLLPIRSLGGTFAWVSSPYVLRRFARDARDAGIDDLPAPPDPPAETCALASEARLVIREGQRQMVVLEDLDLQPSVDTDLAPWATKLGIWLFPDPEPDATYWRTTFTERLCVVQDEVFSFLLNTATEVVARIKLKDDTKTVANGQLWYEEALPAESILSSMLLINPVQAPKRKALDGAAIEERIKTMIQPSLQFGGKATVGRGVCRVRLGGA